MNVSEEQVGKKRRTIDLDRLANAIEIRMGRKTFEEAAMEIGGISPATLNNIRRQVFQPELDSYVRICRWLDKNMEYFLLEEPATEKAA